jgi:uncharacterized DUF497 family protein
MTWPPVTGRAWPVSYSCSTRYTMARSTSSIRRRLVAGVRPHRRLPFARTVDKEVNRLYIVNMKYIHFIWDNNKSALNMKKHGISFEEARTAFFDERARVIHDAEHSSEEDRFLLLGMSRRLRLLVGCHCYRDSEEQIRIISARRATESERRYYGGQGHESRV